MYIILYGRVYNLHDLIKKIHAGNLSMIVLHVHLYVLPINSL